MLLNQLLQNIPGVPASGSRGIVPGAEIRGVTSDPDRAGPEMLFAAIPERLANDPLGVQTAVGRGAPAVICRPGTPTPAGTHRITVNEPGIAFADAAAVLNGNPLAQLELFRVSGTVKGAATAAAFLHALLSEAGRKSALLTSTGGVFAGRMFPQNPVATESQEWQRLLAGHLRAGGESLVIEERPEVLEVLGSTPARRETRITSNCPRLIEPLATHWRGSRVKINTGGPERIAHLGVVGAGNLSALNLALSAAIAAGCPASRLAAGLPTITTPSGSMEPVNAGQPYGVFIDGAASAEEIAELVREARALTSGSVILVTGASSQTTSEQRRLLGRAASSADRLILTADNPRHTRFAGITADILRGTTRAAQVEPERHKAIASAIRQARTDDVVLIAGKGRRPVQEIEGTVLPWDDRLHARDALSERGWVGDEL